ncbi:uncharacterized protein LOC127851759 [Dreissena polymorpha]|uniref:uncharacterized protein LOC127851759 n=1 Tax=Dreissena polymorpha TaxID=45954 RepID=UPI0022647964|nr:uncharacterized protein LOC127851759 [Dreissena polymorpha]
MLIVYRCGFPMMIRRTVRNCGSEKLSQFLPHMQVLLINFGPLDVVDQISTLPWISDEIDLRPAPSDNSTNIKALVLVINQAIKVGKDVDRIWEWLPKYTVVEENTWDCPFCIEKVRQLRACDKLLEHVEAQNVEKKSHVGGVAVEQSQTQAVDFDIKIYPSNSPKCLKFDIALTIKHLAVCDIMNVNTASRTQLKAMKITEHRQLLGDRKCN